MNRMLAGAGASARLAATEMDDPATRRRIGAAVLALVVLWPILVGAEFKPWRLFDAASWSVMRSFLGGFLPPSHDADFLRQLGKATLETLAIATAGMTLSTLIGAPLAFMVARALSVSRFGPKAGRRGDALQRTSARAMLTFLRSLPEVVWALLFVRALGLGPGAGVLAIGITYGGMLGKVWSEIIDSGETRPARALLEAGSSRLGAVFYALLPQNAGELASYTVYRWECAVRASVVMGFVGAGGLGQLMDQSMKMLNGGEASAILLVFLLLVLLADAISALVRKVLA